jgi:hypothetical protein
MYKSKELGSRISLLFPAAGWKDYEKLRKFPVKRISLQATHSGIIKENQISEWRTLYGLRMEFHSNGQLIFPLLGY